VTTPATPAVTGASRQAPPSLVRLGLRANMGQFLLLVAVNATASAASG
jgi:hypothetical protein